ncbi:hypothetical protein FEM48_Zijuj01G0266900 [Ziziphus jujuba var. spinosa]|uniref:Protein kinase domain-containing protein n=1 Tax=Ziziphus jujuba var. spinosa TaxID=714518 RepID=A0A978W525_ZIZJJ|nr:hypothetical protein FEM48_Zijuj01G0266900 [Ziziphus jujuba var. spinosa]
MAVVRLLLLRPYDHLIIFSVIFLVIFSPMTHSLTEAEALLKLKNSFTNAQALDSWVPGTVPCTGKTVWKGLVCFNGIVTGLRLGGLGLSGVIDVNTLREIKALRTISLVNNSFSGSIPDFHQLGALKAIYLSGNQFSGEIPSDNFAQMDSLKKLWLSDNKFTGNIPSSLCQLSHLIELHLENNQFSGTIPEFNIPTLVSLDLSNNKLEGEIPDSLSKFNASSFSGNAGLCGEKLGIDCKQKAAEPPTSNENADSMDDEDDHSKKIIASAITIGVVLLSLVIWLIIRSKRKGEEDFDNFKKANNAEEAAIVSVHVTTLNKKEVESVKKVAHSASRKGSIRGKSSVSGIGELFIMNDEKGVFGLSDLMKAAAEVLGNGGLGSSYKAVMANGVAVVVKRMREMNAKGKDEFDAEIAKLGKLRHWNVLPPIAYHYRKEEKLIIYEFIPKGNLLYLLHELNWPARLRIVQGIAKGLAYLYTEFASSDLPHGNLKSSNVLLGPDYEPLISDFGFSPLINSANLSQALFAYKSPEAIQFGKVSRKSDVYCLGIVILEILTGKFPSQYLGNGKGGTDIVQWVASAISEGRGTELLDPEISSSKNSLGEMEKLLIVGSACAESDPERRLEMMEAIRRIQEVQVEGNRDGREMHLQPSLRDGYGDCSTALQPQTHTISLKDGFGEVSAETKLESGSYLDGPGSQNADNFAFPIS